MGLNERNEELNKRIGETDLPNAVATLVADAKKRKRQIVALIISLMLDFVITVVLGLLAIQTHTTAMKAESNQQALMSACETTNNARANNKQLWDYLLSLPTPNAPTLQQQQVRNQFSAFVNKTFAPADCNKIIKN